VVVLSPHLDDAALSCGGLIGSLAARGVPVTVVSVFTAEPAWLPPPPLATWFHDRCGLGDDAMAVRKGEDNAAARVLEVSSRHLELEECLYRRSARGSPVYRRESDIFAAGSRGERRLVTALAERLSALPEVQRSEVVLAPLGIGGHVDHGVVRRAAARCLAAEPRRALLYEDVPYLLYRRCAGWERAFTRALRPSLQAVSAQQWSRKLCAIELYRSQAGVLWERPDRWRDELTAYASRVGGGGLAERFWSERRWSVTRGPSPGSRTPRRPRAA
jgi:LmbE family N-acetylglucosaminyl deacetylase